MSAALNEGRRVSPGYRRRFVRYRVVGSFRSTKAGEYPPATVGHAPRSSRSAIVRSTKAGEYPPATAVDGAGAEFAGPARSTKAGEYPPATGGGPSRTGRKRRRSLNEGRGVSPGYRRLLVPRVGSARIDAQRRPGSIPRLQVPGSSARSPSSRSLNEGRGVSPGYRPPPCGSPVKPCSTALNEGRGVSPGYSIEVRRGPVVIATAQRRPGSIPRLQAPRTEKGSIRIPALNEGRGVSPGYSRRRRGDRKGAASAAQRRPGSIPRLQSSSRPSTRAGRSALNEGRGVSPGYSG